MPPLILKVPNSTIPESLGDFVASFGLFLGRSLFWIIIQFLRSPESYPTCPSAFQFLEFKYHHLCFFSVLVGLFLLKNTPSVVLLQFQEVVEIMGMFNLSSFKRFIYLF